MKKKQSAVKYLVTHFVRKLSVKEKIALKHYLYAHAE